MKNFFVTIDKNKTYWISRSCTTECIIFNYINDVWCVLANKRGSGCTNNVGLWNVPAGYLEYDETLEECAARETFEETGLKISKHSLNLVDVDSTYDSESNSQNVIVAYWTTVHGAAILNNENADADEVVEIKWIPVQKIDQYRWISKKHIDRIKKAFIACSNKELCSKKYK